MPSVKRRASKILNEYGAAQSELIGKAVVLTDGTAGKVMTPHIPEEFSTRLIDWSPFVIMGNTMPPRDPDEDEEDEEEEDRADEPPVVREPDED